MLWYQKSSVEPFAQMKHKKQRIPRSEAMTKAQNFKTPSHSAESQYSATDEFDHSHFYTGKSSPYIGSKIPKCCYLLSVAKTRNPYPPQPFFFTSPFFWEKNPVGCHHHVQRLSISNGIFFHLILRSCFWHLHVCHEVVSPGIKRQRSRLDFLHSKGEGNILRKHIPVINISKWIKKGKGHPHSLLSCVLFSIFQWFPFKQASIKSNIFWN